MLEILILWLLGKKVAAMCKDRGRAAWPWVVLLVLSWYGGALAGAVVAFAANLIVDPNAPEPDFLILLGGVLCGAVLGVSFTLLVVSLLPPVERYDDDIDASYDRRRSRRDEDEDDDDRPRKYRRSDGDEDSDRPRTRRGDDEYDRDKTW